MDSIRLDIKAGESRKFFGEYLIKHLFFFTLVDYFFKSSVRFRQYAVRSAPPCNYCLEVTIWQAANGGNYSVVYVTAQLLLYHTVCMELWQIVSVLQIL